MGSPIGAVSVPGWGRGMHLGSDFVNWEKFLFPSPGGVGDASPANDKATTLAELFPSPGGVGDASIRPGFPCPDFSCFRPREG